ncbi:MAG TPA: DUF4339 domain-containing protein [Candidatus Didemnitutus sp.]|nr:DUF4339 domain-containing protein [Candidatus Didemnitutus sp.]
MAATEWFYAEGKEKRGPLPEPELIALIQSGRLAADVLVWNAGLSGWKAVRDTSMAAALPAGAAALVCIITGKVFPPEQMIRTEHGWVSAEGKDRYYQSLREGVPLPLAAGVTNARADGKRIVVPITNPRLPSRCVKTNEPASFPQTKTRTLYWYPPLIALTLLVNVLIFLIVYLIVRKALKLEIPLSKAGKGIVIRNGFICLGICLGGIACMFLAAISSGLFILIGILILLGGLVFGATRGGTLRVTKMKNGEAWLAGASPEYLASLPPYPSA